MGKHLLHTVGPRIEHTNEFTPKENLTFVNLLIANFNTAERMGWGSEFYKAEQERNARG